MAPPVHKDLYIYLVLRWEDSLLHYQLWLLFAMSRFYVTFIYLVFYVHTLAIIFYTCCLICLKYTMSLKTNLRCVLSTIFLANGIDIYVSRLSTKVLLCQDIRHGILNLPNGLKMPKPIHMSLHCLRYIQFPFLALFINIPGCLLKIRTGPKIH